MDVTADTVTVMSENLTNATDMAQKVSPETIVLLSILFTVICTTGLVGNALVVFVILVDRKMRKSSTNLFIMNLAVADFVIMLFGIPEIVMFMMDRGWTLGQDMCKFNRYVLTSSLYASVLTLLSVCVERFIAIIQPIKAHILCGRKKVMVAIGILWPIALLCGLPTVLFNREMMVGPGKTFCLMIPPGDRQLSMKRNRAFKVTENIIFYIVPVVLQIVLYSVVAKRLFAGIEELHAQNQTGQQNGGKPEKTSEAVKARKSVVIMLIACVIVYVISFSPQAVMVYYNMISDKPFHVTWPFLVFVMIMANVNSAANPVFYSIFSQNFRKRFKYYVCFSCYRAAGYRYARGISDFDSRTSRRPPSTSKTVVSSV